MVQLVEKEAQEFTADFSTGRVNVEAGLIEGVKILGPKSTNGREYTPKAMSEGAPLYEGAPVYVDHNLNPKEGRSYRDRFGVLQGIRYEATGLFGDLKYNPRHAVAEQFVWDVQNKTPRVGFSHTVLNRVRVTRGGTEIVEQIAKVLSVDLVSNPATTSTVFEQTKEPPIMADENTTQELAVRDATVEQVKVERPGLYEDIGSQWAAENTEKLEVEADRHVRQRMDILIKENEELRGEIVEARESQQSALRRTEVDHKVLQAGVPRDIDDKVFREQLYEAADRHGMDKVDALIQYWRNAVGRHRPVSREQGGSYQPILDGKSFAQNVQR